MRFLRLALVLDCVNPIAVVFHCSLGMDTRLLHYIKTRTSWDQYCPRSNFSRTDILKGILQLHASPRNHDQCYRSTPQYPTSWEDVTQKGVHLETDLEIVVSVYDSKEQGWTRRQRLRSNSCLYLTVIVGDFNAHHPSWGSHRVDVESERLRQLQLCYVVRYWILRDRLN